ncbi:MAG: hypothetical protein ABIS17_13490 [Casimicrobiaceae bacterium]
MKTLLVYLPVPWQAADAIAWRLVDSADRSASTVGRDRADQWPKHDRLEIVIAAAVVRLVPLDLPPMPAGRLAAASRFAIEDQIAGGEAGVEIAVGARHEGRVVAIVSPRAMLESLRERAGPLVQLARIVVEPELCDPAKQWRWCFDGPAAEGFVRLPDGGAFATSPPGADGALPAELSLALRTAPPGTGREVRVEGFATADDLARWSAGSGVAFMAGEAWQWHEAARHAHGTNLLHVDRGVDAAPAAPRLARLFAPTLALLASALTLQVLGMAATWVALQLELRNAASAWPALGQAAGVPHDALTSAESSRTALARRHAALAHAQRQFVRSDALPLLAGASIVLAPLPPGSVKRAVYGDDHWTFDLAGVELAAMQRLDARFRESGLEGIVVPFNGGVRVRLGVR